MLKRHEAEHLNIDSRLVSMNTATFSDNPVGFRSLKMSWHELWGTLREGDGKKTGPKTITELQQCITTAAEELGWLVWFIGNDGICLDDGDAIHYFRKYDLLQNVRLAIGLLRREVSYIASTMPNTVEHWSPAGIDALSAWIMKGSPYD